MSGGFGQEGVDAIEQFLDGGGTLITAAQAVRLPDRVRLRALGRHATVPWASTRRSRSSMAKIVRTDSPVFYGYRRTRFPVKFGQGAQVFHVGVADPGERARPSTSAATTSVLSGLMTGADALKRPAVRGRHPEGATTAMAA